MKQHPFAWHNFVSRLIRRQIALGTLLLGHDMPVLILPLRAFMWRELWCWGPSFKYKGDEVVWSWRQRHWTSVGCEGVFPTLQAIDEFWEEYARYCEQPQEEVCF